MPALQVSTASASNSSLLPIANKRRKLSMKPPPPPPQPPGRLLRGVVAMQRVVRLRNRRFGRWPMAIDSPPLPERMKIDDPWSSNLVTLDTKWVNDSQGGLLLNELEDIMVVEMEEAGPLSSQGGLFLEGASLPTEDLLEVEKAGPSQSQVHPKLEEACLLPPSRSDGGSSKPAHVVLTICTFLKKDLSGSLLEPPESPYEDRQTPTKITLFRVVN
ncbi:hypothetical protein BC943DRAFT_340816 [Umbelopsis sp. AD052]|nr:hypothetical protein BC943DRAFT_340816 [Umbelopsis sp. AD052]